MNGSGNKTVWTEDTIAGVILGCAGCFFVQTQLQGLASRLNRPAVDAMVQWWPMLLIVAGLALWLRPKADVGGGGK